MEWAPPEGVFRVHAAAAQLRFTWHALPFAHMCSTIDVKHLPSDLMRLGEIEHGVDDVLNIDDASHGRQSLQEVLRVVLMHGSIDDSGRNRVDANAVLYIFHRETSRGGLDSALR